MLQYVRCPKGNAYAGVMELADVTDSKSVDGDIVWVRVPPPAPKIQGTPLECPVFLLLGGWVRNQFKLPLKFSVTLCSCSLLPSLASAGFRVPPPAPKTQGAPKGYPVFLLLGGWARNHFKLPLKSPLPLGSCNLLPPQSGCLPRRGSESHRRHFFTLHSSLKKDGLPVGRPSFFNSPRSSDPSGRP